MIRRYEITAPEFADLVMPLGYSHAGAWAIFERIEEEEEATGSEWVFDFEYIKERFTEYRSLGLWKKDAGCTEEDDDVFEVDDIVANGWADFAVELEDGSIVVGE